MATGVNIDIRKRNKRNIILNTIRNHPGISRIEVKRLCQYSMSTVLSVIDDLLKRKLIYESGVGESKVGRRPTWLEINRDGGYCLGIEFNAEFLFSVAMNLAGEIVYSRKYPIDESANTSHEVIRLLKKSIYEMIDTAGLPREKILGIGIGAPGFVDDIRGISTFYPHLTNWKDVHIKDEIEKEFAIDTYLESNINAMALAYKWLRPHIYGEDFLLISIRTGIRMSLMINNELYKGKDNNAGEIGHIRIGSSNRICSCGRKGCLEAEVSNKGIRIKLLEGISRNRFRELLAIADGKSEDVSMQTFVESYSRNHPDSIELFEETCEYLGEALCNVVNMLNPSRIIIAGEITRTGEVLLDRIKAKLNEKAIHVNLQELKIEYSSFDENIGAVGAAALIMNKEFEFYSQHP